MMGLSDLFLLALVALVVVLVLLAVAASVTNPVVDVADELSSSLSPEAVASAVGETLAALPRTQLRLVLPATWTVSYRRHPRYAVLLGILTLPIGLLVLLLVRETLQLTVSVTRDDDHTRVLVVGRAHQKLALALGARLGHLTEPAAQHT